MARSASVVTYTVGQEHAAELAKRVQEHLVPAARAVEGYEGFLLLDQGEGKRMAILVFDSLEGVASAQAALSPLNEQYTASLMTSGSMGSRAAVVLADGLFDSPE